MVIKGAPQIVCHPLAYAGSEVFFGVRTDGADHCNSSNRGDREIQDGELVVSERRRNKSLEPNWQFLRLQDVVDYNLDRPRFQNVTECLAQYCDERERQRFPVWPDKAHHAQFPGLVRASSFWIILEHV